MATLFSYFTKSPKVASTAGKNKSTSPKEEAKHVNGKSGKTPPANPRTPVAPFVVRRHNEGDIVWAKMDGHPWWPSMICKHPSTGEHERKSGKFISVHVQFFGEPPTRGWVKKRYENITKIHLNSICEYNNRSEIDPNVSLNCKPSQYLKISFVCLRGYNKYGPLLW